MTRILLYGKPIWSTCIWPCDLYAILWNNCHVHLMTTVLREHWLSALNSPILSLTSPKHAMAQPSWYAMGSWGPDSTEEVSKDIFYFPPHSYLIPNGCSQTYAISFVGVDMKSFLGVVWTGNGSNVCRISRLRLLFAGANPGDPLRVRS